MMYIFKKNYNTAVLSLWRAALLQPAGRSRCDLRLASSNHTNQTLQGGTFKLKPIGITLNCLKRECKCAPDDKGEGQDERGAYSLSYHL